MAMNQKQQLVVIVAGVVVAAYMGYTTLFPNTVSTYAEQSAESMVVEASPVIQAPGEVEQSTLSNAEPTGQTNTTTAQAKLHAQAHLMVSKVNQFLDGEMLNAEPFRLDVDSARLLSQSQSITDATMKAKLREQNQRHQLEKSTHERLGINAPMVLSTPIADTGNVAPKATSYPVYLFRMADGPTIARIQYQDQWIKVHPGMELGTIKVLRITSKGVTVRENGKTRLLTPRDS